MDKILTSFELLAVCVGAISHDVNHQGVSNIFTVKTETPIGILYKNQSVMETHHCAVLISIMNRPDCNLFSSLDSKSLRTIWKWIIHLILATDMAVHFKLINQANNVLENGAVDLSEETHRLMAIELLLKVSDISNVSRPFVIADKWCDFLTQEFYCQGDLEVQMEMDYTTPLNDRYQTGGKAKGQVSFYNTVCLPLYNLIVRLFPELEPGQQSLLNNLNIWKKIVEVEKPADDID